MKAVKARKDARRQRSRSTGLDQVDRRHEEPDAGLGPCALRRRRTRSRSTARRWRRRKIFINVGGRAGRCRDWPGIDDVPLLTNTSMMAIDYAARAPDRRRRQLHRPRVRADVPALRLAGHGASSTATALIAREDHEVSARGAADPRARRRRRSTSRVQDARWQRRGGSGVRIVVRRRRPARTSSTAATCCSPSAGARTPTTSASTRPASPPTRAATSRSTTSCAPACPASGRSATSTAAAPSRTPPTTTTRSSPPTCSTASSAGVSDRITAYALFIDPPLGRVGMTEAEVRARGRPALVGVHADDPRRPRASERGETQGFMKVLVDAETRAHPRRRAALHRGRRDRPLAARRRWRPTRRTR